MNTDFEEYVAIRCQRALEENEEYMDMESGKVIAQDELQALAEKLCYIKGYRDALDILKCSQNM